MPKYVPELIECVQEVFQTMLFMEAEHLPEGKPDIDWPPKNQCTAMVGLAGEGSALVYVNCEESFAFHLTSTMMGMDIGDDLRSVIDAMGEIANMVGGNLKNKVLIFDSYQLSMPSVIVGKNFQMHTPGGKAGTQIWFRAGDSHLLIELVVKE